MIDFSLVCSDAPNAFLGLFDFSIAPPLLYYAYIPISLVALLLGIYVLVHDRYSYRSKLLFSLSVTFTLLLLNEILQWTAAPVSLVLFGWELVTFFRILVAILTVWFVYVFINDRGFPVYQQIILSSAFLLAIVLTPTVANIQFFDINNCEGVPGWLWNYVHIIEGLAMLWIAVITFGSKAKTSSEKYINIFVGTGAIVFLCVFSAASIWGDVTTIYDVALVGPAGMIVFLAFLTFVIVRYRAFNIKLIGAQALVISLIILISSQFFFVQNNTNRLLISLTLVVTGFIGINLIRSVKKEVEQREHIEQLAAELRVTNERQEGLLHYIGHEVKGFLTKDAGAFAALADGDFGQLQDGIKDFVESALTQSRDGVRSVTDILTASNQKRGTISYNKSTFDLKAIIEETIGKARRLAEGKGLTLSFSADQAGEPYSFSGDKEKIADNVLRNLIENSIYYTPSGSVAASLKKEAGKIVFAVKDTGIGISEEDKKNLFTEGGHGKDSQKINAHSTGYGLFIAKNIVEAHGGTIRAESEGQGKGSTFTVELPA